MDIAKAFYQREWREGRQRRGTPHRFTWIFAAALVRARRRRQWRHLDRNATRNGILANVRL